MLNICIIWFIVILMCNICKYSFLNDFYYFLVFRYMEGFCENLEVVNVFKVVVLGWLVNL